MFYHWMDILSNSRVFGSNLFYTVTIFAKDNKNKLQKFNSSCIKIVYVVYLIYYNCSKIFNETEY